MYIRTVIPGNCARVTISHFVDDSQQQHVVVLVRLLGANEGMAKSLVSGTRAQLSTVILIPR